jgi:hypothetical protein
VFLPVPGVIDLGAGSPLAVLFPDLFPEWRFPWQSGLSHVYGHNTWMEQARRK